MNKLCERLGGTPSPDMSYRKHVLNLLFEANTQQPIDILWVEGTSLGRPCDGDEIFDMLFVLYNSTVCTLLPT